MSVNKAILIGNVGNPPEIRSMNNGKRVASFSLATSESWKGKDGSKQEKTEWHKVSVFSDGLVSLIEKYVSKGDKLYIEGKIQTRKWQDQSGQDRYSTEIVLQGFDAKLLMLSSKDQSNHDKQKSNGYQAQPLDDSIPF